MSSARTFPLLVVCAALVLGAGVGAAWAAFSATTSSTGSFSVASDLTAPTISRSVVAKAGSTTGGAIRQGGDYHVYAQVSDSGSPASGIATVTADTSSFDTGVTAAALSSSGGPWTIDGTSYNYRSATLTADTPLTTGASYPYSVTAADADGNARTESSSVTIETYSGVIAATSGLVSHWRLGDGAIAGDEFTDSSGTLLSDHTGAVGASWTRWSSLAPRTALVTSENRIRKETGNDAAHYYASGTPSGADYLVEANVHVKSLLATDAIAVVGRMDTSDPNGTYYLARYEADGGNWDLFKVVSGNSTALGSWNSPVSAGSTYRLSLVMNGSTIRLLVNGVQRVSVTDTAITAAGRGGVRLGRAGSTAQPTDTAGLHLDNFRVSSLTTTAVDSAGANTGTYVNGTRLNRAGALVGDSDRASFFDGSDDSVSIPDAASLDLGDGALTLEAWVKRANTADGSIIDKGSGGYELWITGNRLTLRKAYNADVVQSTTTIVDTTSWHHVVATKNGANVKLYIDGVDVTGTVTNQTLVDTADALAINGMPKLSAHIDEVAIYNTVLSEAEVLNHYKAGSGTG